MPVKVIWGREDRWIDVRDAHRLGEKLGAKEIIVIEKAGHLIMYDQPGQLGVELGVCSIFIWVYHFRSCCQLQISSTCL
jgi:pimeloyl-ACP methyl ester carboxylesterase